MNAANTAEHERVYYMFEEIDEPSSDDRVIEKSEPVVVAETVPLEKFAKKPGFWRRQFGREVTRSQRKFDWIAGVFLPLICFYFDPFVFRGWEGGGGTFLSDYQSFAYLLAFVSVMLLAAWLLWGERLEWLLAPLAGIFLAASLISLAIGVVLFPFSLIGTLLLIGLLGFTPLFTAICFARNGVRAMRTALGHFDKSTLIHIAAISGLASVVIPYVINVSVN
ncbi:MAG: hypothetical protein WBO10_07370 [Pyrinomonadaceae bacterium]